MRNKQTHRNDMWQADIEQYEIAVKERNQWVVGDYAKGRMTERAVTERDVALTLADGYLVEVNETQGLCIVMRRDFETGYSVCVVVNSTTGFIITTWKNKKRDASSLLDMSKFRAADGRRVQVWSVEQKWLEPKLAKESHVRA